jgi:hypothetical protein
MQDASNPTFLSTQEELYPTDKRVDMNNPFHTLSDDDEVMEDAMEGEITQETEIASQQTGVATGKKASSESSNESQESGDSELNSVQTGTPPDKDSKPSASSTQEDIAIENRTYSRLSDRDKAIADKAKEANRLRKKELLREYEQQASAHSVASSSKAGPTVTQMQSPSSTNLSSKLSSTSKPILRNTVSPDKSTGTRKNTGLDKPITLKRGMTRAHIHRYDIRLTIKKPKSDDEEEGMVIKALQRFLDIMLQADSHTIIPPYFELDRTDTSIPDVCKEFLVTNLDSFASVKRYFSRLSPRNETTGFVYCSAILAQNKPFKEVVEKIVGSIRNQDIGVWPKASDHESSTDVGWLLYSTRQQDEERLSALLSNLTGETLGVKWKPIRTTEGFTKRDPSAVIVRALHIEGPSDRAHEIRLKLAKWYSSSSTSFPDGTKMRLIPPFHTIISSDSKIKFGTLVARQEALNRRLAYSTTTEFATNLTLDKPEPKSGISLRQILMNIPSSVYDNTPVFHTIDRAWKDNGVTFTFVPENESDGRMFVAGLIPYLRAIDPWYLSCFTEDARYGHRLNHWDPKSKQVLTLDELGMGDNIYIDDNLNCSDEPTAVRPANLISSNEHIEVVVPDVEITGSVPPLLKETDSVSTFRSKKGKSLGSVSFAASMLANKQSQQPEEPIHHPAPQSGKLPRNLNKEMEDGSVSKLSDTASKLSAFEERFTTVTEEIAESFEEFRQTQSEQRELLATILKHLQISKSSQTLNDISTQPSPSPVPTEIQTGSTEAEDRQSSITSAQANHLSKLNQAGDSSDVAGTDS